MINKKTKKQKEIDNQNVLKAYKNLHKKADNFVREVYELEFDVRYLNIGTVSDMLESVNKVNFALGRQKEGHTYSDYTKDSNKKEWANSTWITRYKEK